VNGLRAGVAQAVREFCEFPCSGTARHQAHSEDVWDKASYVLSVKIHEPQFAGQMKERLGSRDAAALVEAFVRDSMALWLNRHPDAGERIAQLRLPTRRSAPRLRSAWCAAHGGRTGPTGQARRLHQPGTQALGAVPGGRRFRRRLGKQARDGTSRPSCRCAARS